MPCAKNIISRLANWNPYSDSSPAEGIEEAINSYYAPGRKISIYIYGDDFPQGQVEAVARYVDRVNSAGRGGERLVRIHAVGSMARASGAGRQVAVISAESRPTASNPKMC